MRDIGYRGRVRRSTVRRRQKDQQEVLLPQEVKVLPEEIKVLQEASRQLESSLHLARRQQDLRCTIRPCRRTPPRNHRTLGHTDSCEGRSCPQGTSDKPLSLRSRPRRNMSWCRSGSITRGVIQAVGQPFRQLVLHHRPNLLRFSTRYSPNWDGSPPTPYHIHPRVRFGDSNSRCHRRNVGPSRT